MITFLYVQFGENKMGKIPATMFTQHPDSATTYVPVQKEAEEAVKVLMPTRQGGFGIDEYMIDFEGKMTPYVQTSEVVVGLISKGLVPGKDVFITPRIPSVSQETVFRQLMAPMSIMEAYYRIHEEITEPSIVEVIHPMSKSAQELIDTRKHTNGSHRKLYCEDRCHARGARLTSNIILVC
jgi:phosphoenolpyruvate carboxylase